MVRSLIFVFVAALIAGCAANPTGGFDVVLMSEERELEVGKQHHQQLVREWGIYDDRDWQAYVAEVGEGLAEGSHRSELDYTFTVIDQSMINAFALPGGYVYVSRGLLPFFQCEDELAAVLAHEIGHVTARHSVKSHTRRTAGNVVGAILGGEFGTLAAGAYGVGLGAVTAGYSRSAEHEADRLGAEYLLAGGYDPGAMERVLDVLRRHHEFEVASAKAEDREPRVYHGLFASHPKNERRIADVRKHRERLEESDAIACNNPQEFLARLDGLPYGESGDEGVLHDGVFYHGPLDLRVELPEGWHIDNTPDALYLKHPTHGDASLMVRSRVERMSHVDFLRKAGFHEISTVRTIDRGALQGRIVDARHPDIGYGYPARVLIADLRAYTLLFAAQSKPGIWAIEEELDAMFDSMRAGLSEEEKRIAAGKRIRVHRVARGEDIDHLLSLGSWGPYPERAFRLLNRLGPDDEPRAGDRVKLVVAGE